MGINDLISSINQTDKYEPQFQLNYKNALRSAGILKKADKENFMSDIGGWVKNNPNLLTAILGGLGGLTGGAMGKGPGGGILGALLLGMLGHQAPRLWGGKPADLFSSEEWVGTDAPESTEDTDDNDFNATKRFMEQVLGSPSEVNTDAPESTEDTDYTKEKNEKDTKTSGSKEPEL